MKSHASMNRIYRLVFNAALGIWVAVAENARGKGKAGRAASALLAVLAIISPAAHAANAADATLRGGTGTVATVGNTTTVNQTSQRMAIDWTQLSTAAGEALQFNQPNAQAIALNRITGSSPSTFLGSLTANGQVFILNPNGILFGAGSQVNVGGIVASTLGMNPTDFMNGSTTFTKTKGTGSVINQGSMTAAQGGYLALLAPEVRNEGVMTATLGTALLAAGNKVTLNLNNGSLLSYSIDQGAINALAENKQLIKADGGQVLLSARALDALTTATVNNTGVIEAKTIQNIAGRIMLMGDMEHGTVNVGGTLDASAPNGGNGGFIETSAAKVHVASGSKITTLASAGKTGTWLIDPTDFTIIQGNQTQNTTGIGTNDLAAALANNNVEIETVAAGAGQGNIEVQGLVSWTSGRSLTLRAHNNISFVNSGVLDGGSTGTVGLFSGGRISSSVNYGADTVDVRALVFGAYAVGGIGLRTRVSNLTMVNSGTGSVDVLNIGNVIVGGSNTGGDIRVTTRSAADSLTGGDITVATTAYNQVEGLTVQQGGVYLQAGNGGAGVGFTPGGAGGAVVVNKAISATGAVELQAGDSGSFSGAAGAGVTVNAAITAGGDGKLQAGSASATGFTSSNGGSVNLNARVQSGGNAVVNVGTGYTSGVDGGTGLVGVVAGSGIDLTAGQNLSINANLRPSNGNISLKAGMNAGNTLAFGNPDLSFGVAANNVTLQGYNMTLASSYTTNRLSITKANGIGSSGTPLQTRVNELAVVNTVGGGVYVTNQGNMTVAGSSANGDMVLRTANGRDTTTGSDNALAGGNITVGAVGSATGLSTTGAGNVTLIAGNGGSAGIFVPFYGNGGNGGSVTLNAGVSSSRAASITAGNGGAGGSAVGLIGGGDRGGGTGGHGGAVVLNAGLTTSQSATVRAGTGGLGGDGFGGVANVVAGLGGPGAAGGNGGSITVGAALNAGQSASLTAGAAGAGGSGGAGDGDSGGNGANAGLAGSIALNGQVTAVQTLNLMAGAGATGGMGGAGSPNGTAGMASANGSITAGVTPVVVPVTVPVIAPIVTATAQTVTTTNANKSAGPLVAALGGAALVQAYAGALQGVTGLQGALGTGGGGVGAGLGGGGAAGSLNAIVQRLNSAANDE
jgi:filamentous hemagglutinin family protein